MQGEAFWKWVRIGSQDGIDTHDVEDSGVLVIVLLLMNDVKVQKHNAERESYA